MSTTTISHIKDNDYRTNLRKIIEEDCDFDLPSASMIYELGLLTLLEIALQTVPRTTSVNAYAKFEERHGLNQQK